MKAKDLLIVGAIGLGAYALFKINQTSRDRDTLLANPETISYGSTPFLSKEQSSLSPKYDIIRRTNPDGSMTSYRINPDELTAYQRWAYANNYYKIENDTFIVDIPYLPFI